MKKRLGLRGMMADAALAAALALGAALIGCASAPPPGIEISPTKDQAVVSVKRDGGGGSLGEWDIYIDERMVGSVGNGQERRVLVKNGKYFLYLTNGLNQKSEVVSFTAQSNEVTFTAYSSGGLHVTQTSGTQARTETTLLEEAVQRVGEKFINELPGQATVAVLNVSARNRNYSSLVVDNLEFQLIDSRRFKIVDRKQLDTLDAEHQFQMSGDVSEESAVGIGKYLGAGVVITGSITGSGETQRLIVKALDVQTAQIVSSVNERF